MNPNSHKSEKGQILVILVVSLVVLLAFSALAIDVSMTFSDRRYDQSAADAAALSGSQKASQIMHNEYINDPASLNGTNVYFTCSNWPAWLDNNELAQISAAAVGRADANGFKNLPVITLTDFKKDTTQEGVALECRTGNNLGVYVHVKLTSTSPSTFAHLVFGGQLRNTVTAVARAEPFTSLYNGSAIVSLSEQCKNKIPEGATPSPTNDGGMFLDGNHSITIGGGGIFSNSCLIRNGSSGTVNIVDGSAFYHSEVNFNGNTTCPLAPDPTEFSPCPTLTEDLLPRLNISTTCPSTPGTITGGNTANPKMTPGTYATDPQITVNGNNQVTITMEKGIYCFENGFTVTSNPQNNISSLTGNEVMIYMVGGALRLEGGSRIDLTPPGPNASTPLIPGMLILFPFTNTNPITITGNSGSYLQGSIYAPMSQVNIGGNSQLCKDPGTGGSQCSIQVVGDTVTIGGTANVNINYDPGLTALLLPEIDLSR